MSTATSTNSPATTTGVAGPRVVVLQEPGPTGAAALDLARELDLEQGAAVTVVALVPSAPSGPRCGGSALEFNAAVKDTVAGELDQARTRLGPAAGRTDYVLLVEGQDPPLQEWIAARGYDLILLPARRRFLRTPGHPAAGQLRRIEGAEVRIVQRRAG